MKKETLETKTVEELRAQAAKKDIGGRSQMKKDDLVDALSSGGKPSAPVTAKPKSKDIELENRDETVHGHVTIKGSEEGGKRRLFQTSPEVKEWLTKNEAEDKGFYWAELDAEEQRRGGTKKQVAA